MFETSKAHLDKVEESYFEHLSVAFRYSCNCFKASLMALAHGLVRGLFETAASELVSSLAKGRK